MEYILIFIAAVFVNNVVLSQFLGICPFLGVSKKVETATGMGAAVTFVLAIATIVTFLIQKYILDVFGVAQLGIAASGFVLLTFAICVCGDYLVSFLFVYVSIIRPHCYEEQLISDFPRRDFVN